MYKSTLPKKFKASGRVPDPSELATGELVLNTADAKLYTRDFTGTVQLIATPAVQQIDTIVDLDLTAFAGLDTSKGNIVVGAGSTWAALAPGANGDMLLADSSQSAGLRWGRFSSVAAGSAYQPGFIISGATDQVVDILQVKSSTGTTLVSINPKGWAMLGASDYNSNTVLTIKSTEASIGQYTQITHAAANDQTLNTYLLYGRIQPTVATGRTEFGGASGVRVDVLRAGTSAGTLTTIAGLVASYGNQMDGTNLGVTTYNYGLLLQPYNQYGTIQAQYDIYISAPITGGNPGTIAQHYGIYQEDITAQNYLGGITSVGAVSNQGGLVINTSHARQVYILHTYGISAPQNITNYGLQIDVSKSFTDYASDIGSLYGVSSRATTSGSGALTALYGCESSYGGQLSAAGTIQNVYGLRLNPLYANTAVTNLYDIYIAAPAGSGGSATHHYSIYQAAAAATNYLAGKLTVGDDVNVSSTVYVKSTGNDNALEVVQSHTATANQVVNRTAVYVHTSPVISDWVTDGGTSTGIDCVVRTAGAGSGTLSKVIAARLTYGHGLNLGAGGTITEAYGLVLQAAAVNGDVGTLHDLHIPTRLGSGAVSTHYGIYQEDGDAANYFGGRLLVGGPTYTGAQLSSEAPDSYAHGHRLVHHQTAADTRSAARVALSVRADSDVADGATEQAAYCGVVVEGIRKGTGSGTLTAQYGLQVQCGVQQTVGTGNVTSAYGLAVLPVCDTGNTIGTLTGLYLGSLVGSGTVTTKYGVFQADAGASNRFAGAVAANGGLVAAAPSDSVVVVAKGYAGQTANLQEWQNSSGTTLASVNATGVLTAAGISAVAGTIEGNWSIADASTLSVLDATTQVLTLSNSSGNALLDIKSPSSSVLVRGAAAQTADLIRFADSGGNVIAAVGANGGVSVGPGGLGFAKVDDTFATNIATLVLTHDALLQANVGLIAPSIGANANDSVAFATGSVKSGTAAFLVGDTAGLVGSGQLAARPVSNSSVVAVLQGASGQTASLTEWQNELGSPLLKVDMAGRLVTGSGQPALVGGTGAGTSPTVTVVGTDTAGLITVLTGTSPAASSTVVAVQFATAYGSAPRAVIITPANGAAAALSGSSAVFVNQTNTSTTQFTLDVGSTQLAATTTYKWHYLVIG